MPNLCEGCQMWHSLVETKLSGIFLVIKLPVMFVVDCSVMFITDC